jgi:anti-sigma regulatory factor (Ser/Thr protein kinase)
MHLILEAAQLDPELSVQRIRRVCEEVLIRTCRDQGIGEDRITRRPTLERMKGPLVAARIIDRVLAAHIDTIISFGNLASHADSGKLSQVEFVAAYDALLMVVDWYFSTQPADAKQRAVPTGQDEASLYSPRKLQEWRKQWTTGRLACQIDGNDEVAIHDLARLVEVQLSKAGRSVESAGDAAVAIYELVRNAGRHGSSPAAQIEIEYDNDSGRFFLAVQSEGPHFTLQEAVAKYTQPGDWGVHGLENTFWRGDLRIDPTPSGNRCSFRSLTCDEPAPSRRYVRLEERMGSFTLGPRRLGVLEMAWLAYGSDAILSNWPSKEPDWTRVTDILDMACRRSDTRNVRVVCHPRGITMSGWGLIMDGFVRDAALELADDPRYEVTVAEHSMVGPQWAGEVETRSKTTRQQMGQAPVSTTPEPLCCAHTVLLARGKRVVGAGSWPAKRKGPDHRFPEAGGEPDPRRDPEQQRAPCRAQLLLRSLLCMGGDWPQGEVELSAQVQSLPDLAGKKPTKAMRKPTTAAFIDGEWIRKGDRQALPIWWGDIPVGTTCVVQVRLLLRAVPCAGNDTQELGCFTTELTHHGQQLDAVLRPGEHTHLEGWSRKSTSYPSPSASDKTLRMVMEGAGLLGLEVQVRDRDLRQPITGRSTCVRWVKEG